MKLITFAVPCYNSAQYMEKCIESLLTVGDDAEILIVDDGSNKDETAQIADGYERDYPGICRAIHKENGGHGDAVCTGIAAATGLYFKVVDSDDWLDADSLARVIAAIKKQQTEKNLPDLIITNYVYERVSENKQHVIGFKKILPEDRVFSWNEMGKFNQSRNFTMHTITYRTEVLRASGLTLPKHTFYVDNIYAYVPLTYVEKLYYINCDMYRYFIGRDDQSVNEANMIKRLDQQLLITRIMIDAKKPSESRHRAQKKYIEHFLLSVMMISSIFCMLSGDDGRKKKDEIWDYLKKTDPDTYICLRRKALSIALNFKSKLGFSVDIIVYRLAQKIYKFN